MDTQQLSRTRATSKMTALKMIPAFFLQTALVLGTIKSIGVFLPQLKSELGITAKDIGISLGLFQAFNFGFSPIPAYIYCKGSPRYRRLLLISGAVLASVGLISGSTITCNAQLAFYLSISGIGTNCLSTTIVMALHSKASDHFNLFYGIGKSGYSLGMAIVPLFANYLMTVYGWRGSLMIVAGIMTHLIPFSMLVDTTTETGVGLEESPGRRQAENPGRVQEGRQKRRTLDRNPPQTPHHLMHSVSKSHSLFSDVSRVITESIFYRDLWLTFLVVIVGLYGIIGGGWHAFLIPRAVSRGIPISRALILAYSSGVACFIGRFFSGHCLKFFSTHDLFNILTLINCISLLVDILLADFGVVIVTSFLSALSIAVRNVYVVFLFKERSPSTDFPKIYALSDIIFGTFQFIGAFLSGFLADVFQNFNASFIFLLAVDACILVIMIVLRLTRSPSE